MYIFSSTKLFKSKFLKSRRPGSTFCANLKSKGKHFDKKCGLILIMILLNYVLWVKIYYPFLSYLSCSWLNLGRWWLIWFNIGLNCCTLSLSGSLNLLELSLFIPEIHHLLKRQKRVRKKTHISPIYQFL